MIKVDTSMFISDEQAKKNREIQDWLVLVLSSLKEEPFELRWIVVGRNLRWLVGLAVREVFKGEGKCAFLVVHEGGLKTPTTLLASGLRGGQAVLDAKSRAVFIDQPGPPVMVWV